MVTASASCARWEMFRAAHLSSFSLCLFFYDLSRFCHLPTTASQQFGQTARKDNATSGPNSFGPCSDQHVEGEVKATSSCISSRHSILLVLGDLSQTYLTDFIDTHANFSLNSDFKTKISCFKTLNGELR